MMEMKDFHLQHDTATHFSTTPYNDENVLDLHAMDKLNYRDEAQIQDIRERKR